MRRSPAEPFKPEPPTPPRRIRWWAVWVLGGLIFVALVIAIFLLRPQLARLFAKQSACIEPKLSLGAATFRIRTIQRASDGSITVPPYGEGIAYWIEGTDTNYVFVLSPTPKNLALETSLEVGDQATITWANCNLTTYNLSAPKTSLPDDSKLFDQSTSGITLFARTDSSAKGFVVRGELVEETLMTVNTPESVTAEIQAEVSLLVTTTSADKTTIQVGVSILNTGQSAFTLSASDVSLTSEDATPLAPISAEPSLPQEIKPGDSKTIYFTFPHPASKTATLKILSIEYDLENF